MSEFVVVPVDFLKEYKELLEGVEYKAIHKMVRIAAVKAMLETAPQPEAEPVAQAWCPTEKDLRDLVEHCDRKYAVWYMANNISELIYEAMLVLGMPVETIDDESWGSVMEQFFGQQLIEKKIQNVWREMALDELAHIGQDAGEYDGSN